VWLSAPLVRFPNTNAVITLVHPNGASVYRVTFNQPMTFNTGFGGDSHLLIGGVGPSVYNNVSANAIDVGPYGAPATGQTWVLSGQPGWVTSPTTTDGSGTTA